MKVAYLILAHNQPEMLSALVQAIDRPKEQIFVHIDKKADSAPFEKLLNGKCTFIEAREKIYWGSFSCITAYVHLMKAAMSTGGFDYYSLHSGVDFPIKPVNDFEAFLEANKGTEFIECTDCEKIKDAAFAAKLRRRYSGFFLFQNYSKTFRKINFGFAKFQRALYKRRPYNNQPVFFGLAWWTLTHECVKYMVAQVENHPELPAYFKHVHIPDEMFFQTIVGNSPFANNVKNDDLRYIVFEGNNANPKVFTIADKKALLNAPDYFARKFDWEKDAGIVELLKTVIS